MARHVLPVRYPAPKRGVVYATLETKGITDQLRKLGKEAGGPSKAAIRDAHAEMARNVQTEMVSALDKAMRDPNTRHGNPPRSQAGRTGKTAHSEHTLFRAIASARNRQVLLSGFSVGHLDRTRAASYWRVQEYGYEGFKDKIIPGLFLTGSKLSGPVEEVSEHTDARFLQLGQRRGENGRFGSKRQGGVRIKNPIRGYHFQHAGWQMFEEQFSKQDLVEFFYAESFLTHNLTFLAHMLSGTGKRFTVGRINTQGPGYSLDEQ